eukprot:6194541-Pleurochrysis_carterae.AAC.2
MPGAPPLVSRVRIVDAAAALDAADLAGSAMLTLANTPGMDSCSTSAPAAAMHATPMPRTTRVTRKAHGSGARAHHKWCMCPLRTRPRAAC